jgi:hypothetical protein
VLVGSVCKNLIDLGGFLEGSQDTKEWNKITKFLGGLGAKKEESSPTSGQR